jgi:hypothetical protein
MRVLLRRRRIQLGVLAILGLYLAVATGFERRRLAAMLPHAAPAPARLDAASIVQDLRALASPGFEGRRTGTPGGLRARAYLVARFQEAGLQPLGASFTLPFSFTHHSIKALWRRDRPFTLRFEDAANVVGYVKGRSEPERYLVLSAHYDHLGIRDGQVYPGADDNASGVAALLGVARYVVQHPLRHSLIVAAFDAEELGLRGSQAFLASPPVARERMLFDLSLDMISRSDDRSIVASGTSAQPKLIPLIAEAASRSAVGVRLGHDRPLYRGGLVEDWTHGSDHGSFFDQGIPYLYLGVENHADYHQPTDTVDKIDLSFYVPVVELVLDLLERIDRSPSVAP